MAVASKTRIMLEGLVREGSFNWLLSKRSSFNDEFEEMGRSPSAERNWIPELSPVSPLYLLFCNFASLVNNRSWRNFFQVLFETSL
jgi:hypothetical protein